MEMKIEITDEFIGENGLQIYLKYLDLEEEAQWSCELEHLIKLVNVRQQIYKFELIKLDREFCDFVYENDTSCEEHYISELQTKINQLQRRCNEYKSILEQYKKNNKKN